MSNPHIPEPHPPALRPSRLSHLVIMTASLNEMVAWYKTVLMAKPVYETEILSFLTYDDEHHRLLIGNNPAAIPKVPNTVGVAHWAYAFETFEQLVHAYTRLKDEGILPVRCVNHGFTTSLYFHDPDDNEVELAVDNFDEKEAMNEWFSNGAFARNFIGVDFDPEEMVKQHREGADVGKLMAESYE